MPGNGSYDTVIIISNISYPHNYSEDEKLLNLDVTTATGNEQVVPVRERKDFHSNIDKTGYVIFSVSHCWYLYQKLNVVAV